jgi:predicted dehydrogenase/threonine dehydrogenase-like Zn-dependent dehydrogenase
MQQLTQELKSGKMEIMEVPFPALGAGQVLVRNHYSVISAGTEGKTVTDARKGYIAKARSRQKELKQVIEMIKLNGFRSTYQFVMNKLDAPSALGYSSAGEVIAVGEGVTTLKAGDFVACGGASASHADVISVPVNLCVPVPEEVDLRQAAFTTIAAIAIQGIRQAELKLGENCLIIGMGLIGQMTAKILAASGIRAIGVDVSDMQIAQAREAGIADTYNRNMPGIEELILKHSKGNGVDAVLITAGTSSLDPIEFAGSMARKKGKVIIVGAVPTGFDRTNYYKKELDLRMSMSYGPGRGDIHYEEKGIDYPIGYVRWTENRNMQSFVDLLSSGSLDISALISHTYDLENAPEAYDMILSRQEAFNGIVISYDQQREPSRKVMLANRSYPAVSPNIGMIGAGNFAQGILLPAMKGHCNFVGLATARGNMSKYVGGKYGFNYCAESADELFRDDQINTIFITTRHNSHAEYVIKAIEHSKHVFVEKPLAMNEQELEAIRSAYTAAIENGTAKQVMVGFNRRFAPAVQQIKKMFAPEQSKSIAIRVNSGIMPPDHWVNDPEIGGGRIIGEGCHFIDLAMYLAGSKITSVSANAMEDANRLYNTVVINLQFENGSVASVNYFANGSKNLPKEQIEVFCGGTVARIDDFKTLTVYGRSSKTTKFKGQDKGHAAEVTSFLDAIASGKPQPIPFEECYISSLATIKVLQSIHENRKIELP